MRRTKYYRNRYDDLSYKRYLDDEDDGNDNVDHEPIIFGEAEYFIEISVRLIHSHKRYQVDRTKQMNARKRTATKEINK